MCNKLTCHEPLAPIAIAIVAGRACSLLLRSMADVAAKSSWLIFIQETAVDRDELKKVSRASRNHAWLNWRRYGVLGLPYWLLATGHLSACMHRLIMAL